MRDTIQLYQQGAPVRTFEFGIHPLTVGRAGYCDIALHHPSVPDVACRIVRYGGAPSILVQGKKPKPLPYEQPLRIGQNYELLRVCETVAPNTTEPLEYSVPWNAPRQSIVVGSGPSAKRVALTGRALSVGRDPAADIRIRDASVSAMHCRFESWGGRVWLCDLNSKNGTWVDGRRIQRVELNIGARVRVGRRDLRLVASSGRQSSGSPSNDASLPVDGGLRLIAASEKMLSVLSEVDRFAALDWPALITGESGAGKEGIARALHERGPRCHGPFIALNAGGIPANLVESELFGYEKGAFTGADETRRGVFELADGGTLFLDEIGELPMPLQSRLLRVLDGYNVRRVGSEKERQVDVRVVCATHRDLREMVAEGGFREDLFFRLHRAPIQVPPLRERLEDVGALAEHFLCLEVEPRRVLSKEAHERLVAYPWPGNVRELRAVVSMASLLSPSLEIAAGDVKEALRRVSRYGESAKKDIDDGHLRELLRFFDHNLSATARCLEIARSTLRDRVRKLNDDLAQ